MYRLLQLWFLSLTLAGCGALLDECKEDRDCQPESSSGAALFCTKEHLCVRGTPAERLCPKAEIYPPGAPEDALAIGALVEPPAANSPLVLNAYKLAIDQLNLLRAPAQPLALHVCILNVTDDDPPKAIKILVEQHHVVAVVGPDFSREVIALKDEVIGSGVPIMSAGATSPEISDLGTLSGPADGLFYRVVPSDILQGAMLARQLPVPFPADKRLSLVHVDETYGIGLKDAFVRASMQQPFSIASYKEPVAGPELEGTRQAVNQVFDAAPDYVVAVPNRYAHALVKEMVFQTKWKQVAQIFMSEAGKTQDVLNLLRDPQLQAQSIDQLLGRIVGTAPTIDTETPLYLDFAHAFARRWPTDSDPNATVFTGYAYDALYALGIAIGAAGPDLTPSLVSQLLSRLNSHDATGCTIDRVRDNRIYVGPQGYQEAVSRLRTANQGGLVMHGLSGDICFNAHGDRIGGTYEKWSIETKNNGSFRREVLP